MSRPIYYTNDLVPIIEHCAIDLMTEPMIAGKKNDGTLMSMAEVANQNSLIAMNNAGIRLMASALIDELRRREKEDELGD